MDDKVKLRYSEFEFYSIVHDCQCVRISVGDGRTGEFFVIVKKPSLSGRAFREAKDKALNTIEAAIDSGYEPCELEVEQ